MPPWRSYTPSPKKASTKKTGSRRSANCARWLPNIPTAPTPSKRKSTPFTRTTAATTAGLTIAAADRFIKLHPTHPSVDYAYYVKGLANYQENYSLFGRLTGRDDLSDRDASITQNALDAFNDVYNLFPASRYAADAKARAHYLFNALARHELAVAAYYFSRNAHVAVVNRAKGVIENYATTPSVEEALALLVFCYRQMELDDLSATARRVLAFNYPKSEYLNEDGETVLERNLRTPGSSDRTDRPDDPKGGFAPLVIKSKQPAS